MLNNSTSSFWNKGDEHFGQIEYNELIKLGLYREVSKNEFIQKYKNQNYGYGVEITLLGQEVNKFLTQVVAGFVQELSDVKN